jgi:predicted AAA+ superfamily ATPase
MIPRKAEQTLLRLAKGFPIIAITGPRQSGKTTLAKSVFNNKHYHKATCVNCGIEIIKNRK